jgi:hypothetical protein
MNKASKVFTSLAAGVATLFITSVSANNGIQFSEFDFQDESVWVECLDEVVDIHQYVTVASHVVETPSGTWHLVDNWRITVIWTGASTGRTWVGRNVSPFQWNIGPGETNQYVYKGVQKPLTGDGPMFFYGTEFKVTVTANGVMVVDRQPEAVQSDRFRCLGKH